jgi:hypothetical protein
MSKNHCIPGNHLIRGHLLEHSASILHAPTKKSDS